jgi:hypothetical protein
VLIDRKNEIQVGYFGFSGRIRRIGVMMSKVERDKEGPDSSVGQSD